MKNVLISGGAGFIGSHLGLSLTRNGYSVTVLDNLSRQIHGSDPENSYLYKSIKDNVTFIKGDVRNRNDWERSLAGQDAVIHMAAETGTGQSMYRVFDYSDVNIGGTALLLDILTKNRKGVRKLILSSSRAVYGEGRYLCFTHGEVYPAARTEDDLKNGFFDCRCPVCRRQVELLPTHEDSKANATSVYGITKYVQEQLFLVTAKAMHIPAVIYRYQNVYGPGQSLSNPYCGIFSIFSTQIKNGNALNVFEDGQESRDFIFIKDTVNATILGLEDEKADYQVYNVGTGVPVNVLDIARKLTRLYRSKVPINISGNYRVGDIRHNYADITKIRKDLGFTPENNFEKGIAEFVKWVDHQELKEDRYPDSIKELKENGLIR
ncbi:MAG: NAD-dependent epimerase/dehydratase family protein [Bacteroidota bacterium]|nr:NAD-dependent epimerase/dehydratase family protein [Bacteroidota bacterium]